MIYNEQIESGGAVLKKIKWETGPGKTYGFYVLPSMCTKKIQIHKFPVDEGCAIWSADWMFIIGRLLIYKATMLIPIAERPS